MRKFALSIGLWMVCALHAQAQEVWMTPNHGQWDDRIAFRTELQMGEFYIERNGFTFYLHDGKQQLGGHHHDESDAHDDDNIHAHVIRSVFAGADWSGTISDSDSSSFYYNYLIGNDKTKWKSFVRSHSYMVMKDFYPGIDLEMDGRGGALKYSLRVQEGIDPDQILMTFEGQDGLEIDKKGNLHIANRFGEIIQETPVAWVERGQDKIPVPVRFRVDGHQVAFEFPEGIPANGSLVIDPNITFSTFTGSTADNWGMTAAPDPDANLFAGGIVFASGYPVTAGAFDISHNGGQIDVGITKFSANGTSLLYSTYLGGSGSETPHSIVSSNNGELFVFGVTSSPNFPMAGSSYSSVNKGGTSLSGSASNGLDFTGGCDIYIARLNASGSALLASTFVGGTDNDGLNVSPLKFNYGDQFRGEIIVDNMGSVYVASMTKSADFPIVGGNPAMSGPQDAVLFKMPVGLNTITWSTFFGGSAMETGNSVQLASNGNVYVAGGTTSSVLPGSNNGWQSSNSGNTDGYLARFNGTTGAVLGSTLIGSPEYDQAYFVQLDIDDKVYVFGQSETNLGVSPGKYGNPNSGQFIRKYNQALTNMEWTTMIGAGSDHVEISPTAFLVSDCYDIYISGWGGTINANPSYSQAVNSSSNGFPVTPDAFQTSTNGSNFYIAVLDQDAVALKYGTYMGGVSGSSNHVDGGTSRFDKAGRIYHAVCGACGGNPNGFTTTPGVWSPQNQSNNCNLAAFKFELSTIEPIISTPNNVVCIPNPVIFNNNSANGNAFFWDFGDGTYSSAVNPSHVYTSPGTYQVTLVVSDTNGCYSADSVQMEVFIGDFGGSVVQPPAPVCPGVPYQLEASGGSVYQWSPAQYLDNPASATPFATVYSSTDFMVIISDTCGIDTAYVTLNVYPGAHTISNDTSICIGNGVNLYVTGGVSYEWSPATWLDDPSIATPYSLPQSTIEYFAAITTSDGCLLEDSVTITVYYAPPVPEIPDLVNLCAGDVAEIVVGGAESYFWSPPSYITPVNGSVVNVNPPASMWYYCDFVNPCGMVPDSVFVNVIVPEITAGTDTIICPGQSVNLWATGAVAYVWSPGVSLNSVNTSLVTATPAVPTMYHVQGTDANGCPAWDSVWVDLYPKAFIQTNPDVYAFYGDEVQLSATSTTVGPYVWSPAEFLSCVVCVDPIATPNQNYGYLVSYTDENGCKASDSVYIYYDPVIYVPNTFTPNDDSMNPLFLAEGGNIRTFEMLIFDRWGELIFTSNDIRDGWNGTYQGKICQDGTYIWKIRITDFEDEEQFFVGHVNLLR